MQIEKDNQNNTNNFIHPFDFECGKRLNVAKEDTIKNIIRNQIEYYFSNSNLINDEFLWSKIKQHKKGYVNLFDLSKFKRIKIITNKYNLQKDELYEYLIEGIQESNTLRLNKQKTMVKRIEKFKKNKQIFPNLNFDHYSRTVYIEGLVPGISNIEIYESIKQKRR